MRHFLKDTISNKVTIDDFRPKTGTDEEMVVISFYVADSAPAHDLESFLQRSPLELVDVDVSPNPDEDGYYIVFIEIERNEELAEAISFLFREVENVSGKMNWLVKPYLAKKWHRLDDPTFLKYLVPQDIEMDLHEFFKGSMVGDIIVEGQRVTIENINAIVLGIDTFDEISRRINISESVSGYVSDSSEIRALINSLGSDYEVSTLKNAVLVSNRHNQVMVLRDLTHRH